MKQDLFDVKQSDHDPKAETFPLNLKFQYGPTRKELSLPKMLKVFDEMTYTQFKWCKYSRDFINPDVDASWSFMAFVEWGFTTMYELLMAIPAPKIGTGH